MSTKIIGLASYLSPMDLQKAMRLKNQIKSARKVEEVLRYQKQLAFLMAKAERNKKHQERMERRREKIVREKAMQMRKLDRQQIRERYSRLRQEPVGMVVVGKELVEESTGSGIHYELRENAVEGAKHQTIKRALPTRFKVKSHNGNEKNV